MIHYDICIIGAGAAGLSAGIAAAEHGRSVLIIDKNKKAGMKLYATGNGRCNIANSHMAFCCYYDNSFAYNFLGETPYLDVISFMENLGVKCYSKNGYYYPCSNQASTVVWALLDRLRSLNADFLQNTMIDDIVRDSKGYRLFKNNKEIASSDKLILCCGGLSTPALGAPSEEDMFKIYSSLKLKVNVPSPMLCPIITKEDMTKISGVRVNARVSINKIHLSGIEHKGHDISAKKIPETIDHDSIIAEEGEVQFTDYGLSGIVIFNMSYYDFDKIYIDILPEMSEEELSESLKIFRKNNSSRSIHAILNGFINDKMAEYIIIRYLEKSPKESISSLSDDDISILSSAIKKLSFTFDRVYGYQHSQATKGGISTDSVNINNMSVKNEHGLFAAGEALDVQGKCGGYNLMWAFLSGLRAGEAAAKDI
ncbi:MAG: NAD(P)/FAD-dependent oxidoreductase [Eubacterium sp.]|nr:NAD(P)/FAD-dependent oxidoreductase [Eubacterium sp.]